MHISGLLFLNWICTNPGIFYCNFVTIYFRFFTDFQQGHMSLIDKELDLAGIDELI